MHDLLPMVLTVRISDTLVHSMNLSSLKYLNPKYNIEAHHWRGVEIKIPITEVIDFKLTNEDTIVFSFLFCGRKRSYTFLNALGTNLLVKRSFMSNIATALNKELAELKKEKS